MSIAEFKKLHDDMQALRKAGKHEEATKYVTDDAIFMSPMHDPASKADIAEMKKSGKFAIFEKADITNVVDDVKVIGDVAIDRGTITAQLPTGEKKGNYLMVWVKVGGEWKIRNTCTSFRVECPAK